MGLLAQLRRRLAPPSGASSYALTDQAASHAAQAATGLDPAAAQQAHALGLAVDTAAPLFSPGQPLVPALGIEPEAGPRQWGYPAAYNVAQRPRAGELSAFDKLRNLARLYDGAQLCEKVYFDLIRQLQPAIVPVAKDDAGDAGQVAAMLRFFERPDGDLDLPEWCCMAIRDVLEIDALSVYRQRSRAGKLLSLDLIDGSTIKPLLDARGRTPRPPLPGYQQFLYGVPGGLYTGDDLLYRRENPRTDSPYGFSRVEMIVLRVNQALRKQTYDLARFTDGNVPAGFIVPPQERDEYVTWTPDQIQAFEDEFNALLSGNDRARNRIKVLIPGATFTPANPPELFTEFDTFLLNVTVGAFGLTMAELGMTENVNKSSGDSQENVVYRRAVRPVAGFIAALFTRVIRDEWDRAGRYRFQWQGLEEEDKNSVADRYAKLIPVGAASVDDYCQEMGLPKPGIPRYIQSGKGGPLWLTPETVAAAVKAQTAQHAATAEHPFGPPGQQPGKQSDDGDDGGEDAGPDEAPGDGRP